MERGFHQCLGGSKGQESGGRFEREGREEGKKRKEYDRRYRKCELVRIC